MSKSQKKKQKRTKRRMAKKQSRIQRLTKKVSNFYKKHVQPILSALFVITTWIVENYDNIKSIAKDIFG